MLPVMNVTPSVGLNGACTLSASPTEWLHCPESGNETIFSLVLLPRSLGTGKGMASFLSFLTCSLQTLSFLPCSSLTAPACFHQNILQKEVVALLCGFHGLDLLHLGEELRIWCMQCAGKCCLRHSEYNILWTFAFLLMSLPWGLG